MELAQAWYWLAQSERRKLILSSFSQPLTATHVARRTGISRDSCLHHIWSLKLRRILRCLNPNTRFSRLYWLTKLGNACQRRHRAIRGLDPPSYRLPDVPWDVYSSVCYRHRAAVIEAIRGQVQAAAVKRRAVARDPLLRMSANNVRDVMKHLLAAELVLKVQMKRKRHPRYELTELGRAFRELLIGVRVP